MIPTIITQALAGQDVRLGDLRPTRDLNFVQDTADSFMRLALCDKAIGETVQCGEHLSEEDIIRFEDNYGRSDGDGREG